MSCTWIIVPSQNYKSCNYWLLHLLVHKNVLTFQLWFLLNFIPHPFLHDGNFCHRHFLLLLLQGVHLLTFFYFISSFHLFLCHLSLMLGAFVVIIFLLLLLLCSLLFLLGCFIFFVAFIVFFFLGSFCCCFCFARNSTPHNIHVLWLHYHNVLENSTWLKCLHWPKWMSIFFKGLWHKKHIVILIDNIGWHLENYQNGLKEVNQDGQCLFKLTILSKKCFS